MLNNHCQEKDDDNQRGTTVRETPDRERGLSLPSSRHSIGILEDDNINDSLSTEQVLFRDLVLV